MKELLRDQDFTKIGFYQSILESEGIPTHIRNYHLTGTGLSEIPIPEFFPALCVLNDGDYETAVQVLKQRLEENAESSGQELTCPHCSETNPGNFEVCWSCGGTLTGEDESADSRE